MHIFKLSIVIQVPAVPVLRVREEAENYSKCGRRIALSFDYNFILSGLGLSELDAKNRTHHSKFGTLHIMCVIYFGLVDIGIGTHKQP